ncbi:MAG TPA: PQQ-binding-like beta-propeller repeat protein [Planctomycetota bacterium]|jgi:ferric-dicitrate binding protein FerR (iron transport regulator)
MTAISDDDRELWLSRYIDDELDGPEKEAVTAKLRDDERWRADLESMQHTDTTARAVAIKYHEGDAFSKHVARKIGDERKAAGSEPDARHLKPSAKRRLLSHRTSRFPMVRTFLRLAAVVVVGVGAWAGWKAYRSIMRPAPIENIVIDGGRHGPAIVMTEEPQALQWADGTRILARKGTVIENIDDRTIRLGGEAMFRVASHSRPFTVIISEHQTAEALGTRFDVRTGGEGPRVRVAEGRVRVKLAQGASVRSVEAVGGTEVQADLTLHGFDSRQLNAAWKEGGEVVPPWPQSGGWGCRTGGSPVPGPSSLVAEREQFHAFPDAGDVPIGGAVIGMEQKAFVLARNGTNVRLLELQLWQGGGSWKVCNSRPGSAEATPVITPRGLVVTALMDGVAPASVPAGRDAGPTTVSAYDPATGSVVWANSQKQPVRGLCAALDDTVVLSTSGGIVVLDGKNGEALWSISETGDVRLSATALPSGEICVVNERGTVYVLKSGKIISMYTWARKATQPPIVAGNMSGQIWLTDATGYVGQMSLEKGNVTEKRFAAAVRGPITGGLLGQGSQLAHVSQPRVIQAPTEDPVLALAEDGRGETFAGYRRGVLHLRARSESLNQMKELDYASLAAAGGDLIPGGLAIAAGRLLVTMAKGVQVFE